MRIWYFVAARREELQLKAAASREWFLELERRLECLEQALPPPPPPLQTPLPARGDLAGPGDWMLCKMIDSIMQRSCIRAEPILAPVYACRNVLAASLVRALLRRCDRGALVAHAHGHVLIRHGAALGARASRRAHGEARRHLRHQATLVARRLPTSRDAVRAAVPLAPAASEACVREGRYRLVRQRRRRRRGGACHRTWSVKEVR